MKTGASKLSLAVGLGKHAAIGSIRTMPGADRVPELFELAVR